MRISSYASVITAMYAITIKHRSRLLAVWITVRLPGRSKTAGGLADRLVKSYRGDSISPPDLETALQRLMPYPVTVRVAR